MPALSVSHNKNHFKKTGIKNEPIIVTIFIVRGIYERLKYFPKTRDTKNNTIKI
jgi:hypothetical protein